MLFITVALSTVFSSLFSRRLLLYRTKESAKESTYGGGGPFRSRRVLRRRTEKRRHADFDETHTREEGETWGVRDEQEIPLGEHAIHSPTLRRVSGV